MVSLISLLLTAAAIVGGVAAPTPDHIQLQPRQLTLAGSRGYHDGFFYYYWTDGGAPATYRNLEGGSYSLEWGWGGNLIGGKGWENGTETRVVKFSGKFQTNATAYMGIYGYTFDPLVEYWIMEDHGSHNPALDARSPQGNATCDGSLYRLANDTYFFWDQPPLRRYWAVRQSKRSSGTLNLKCFFNAWRAVGLSFGDHDLQIFGTEGYFSNGTSHISISDVRKP